jgi:hypothetical protein
LRLEERLAAQGRLGTSSAAYGGATPEQMAMATAQQEQMNNLALQARQQALGEQQQAAAMGQGMLGSAYMPQSNLLNVLQGGMGVAGLSDVARRQAAMLQSEGQMAGLDAALQAELARGNLTGQGLAALAAALGGQQQAQTSLLGNLTLGDAGSLFGDLIGTGANALGNLFGGIFNGGMTVGPTPSWVNDAMNSEYTPPNYA